ncbi:hypothetical protein BgiMline_029979 [Biomphalaria glabrata]|uniref:Uncharacterized protein LOC106070331 n=1 Tax=Biomphalaria glabrata TaxID=6526 RepID=A0A9W2YQR0_BIOGL|nr:uncharacterized protein LOC106070331 [Biomphalaria glabrata]KAI8736443.1 hypothetical protein BgiMline_026695 [Biomphalaria glabrata]
MDSVEATKFGKWVYLDHNCNGTHYNWQKGEKDTNSPFYKWLTSEKVLECNKSPLTVRSRPISSLPLIHRNRDRVDQWNCHRDRSPSFGVQIDETKDHVDASTSTGTELEQPIVVQPKIQFVCSKHCYLCTKEREQLIQKKNMKPKKSFCCCM